MGEWELYTLKLQRQVPAEVGDLSYPYEDRTFKAAQVAVVDFHERDLARSLIVFACPQSSRRKQPVGKGRSSIFYCL
jgi:hypothetical protein